MTMLIALFEKELTDRGLLSTIEDCVDFGDMTGKQFVKVSGKAYFNDYKALKETFGRFNEIGTALRLYPVLWVNGRGFD